MFISLLFFLIYIWWIIIHLVLSFFSQTSLFTFSPSRFPGVHSQSFYLLMFRFTLQLCINPGQDLQYLKLTPHTWGIACDIVYRCWHKSLIFLYMCLCSVMWVYMDVSVCGYVCMYIYVYICMFMHACLGTCIYSLAICNIIIII